MLPNLKISITGPLQIIIKDAINHSRQFLRLWVEGPSFNALCVADVIPRLGKVGSECFRNLLSGWYWSNILIENYFLCVWVIDVSDESVQNPSTIKKIQGSNSASSIMECWGSEVIQCEILWFENPGLLSETHQGYLYAILPPLSLSQTWDGL